MRKQRDETVKGKKLRSKDRKQGVETRTEKRKQG